MNFKQRTHLISLAIVLIGALLSGLFFFLHWVIGETYSWTRWLMPLSYATFLGTGLIAFIIQFGMRYKFPRGRVIGFFMIIGWISLSLMSSLLETLTILSINVTQGATHLIVLGGLVILVLPGFLLLLLPWPPRFTNPRDPNHDSGIDS